MARQLVKAINDLPLEMLIEIFEKMSVHELVVNASKTCWNWRNHIALFVLKPRLQRLANANGLFKRTIEEDGWTSECNDPGLILSLYKKYEFYSSKYSTGNGGITIPKLFSYKKGQN